MNTQDYKAGKESQKFNLKKPSKKEMETLLDDLNSLMYEGIKEQPGPDSNPDGYKIGQTIAQLQRYFAPNDTAKTTASNPVKWCLQAVLKDGTRKPLRAAKVIDEKLVGCDGRRLHILQSYTEHSDGAILPNGTWISEEEYTKEFGTFPNYKQVMPVDTVPQPDINFSVRPDFKKQLLYDVTTYPNGNGEPVKETAGLDEKFHKQAIAGMENPAYSTRECMSPLVIEDGDRYAVIMPIRIK